MSTVLTTNNAVSRLAGGLTASAATIGVMPGEGSRFPDPSAGQWFPLTLIKSDGALEIVKCTSRTLDSMTVVRAQEGTQALEFAAGDRVELRLTAAVIEYLQQTALIALPLIVKPDLSTPCIIKTSATTLAIKAGTHVNIGNAYVSFPVQTAITMPALTAGEDYSVWVKPDGTAVALADPYFLPAVAPVFGALKIGGFHYGLTAPGTTPASGGFATTGFTNQGGNYPWTQSKVDRIAGINEFSIWDLTHRSKGEQHGFSFDPQRKVWNAIYFCSPDHIANGISRYNTPVASGTVLPKIPIEYGGDGTAAYGRLSAYEALEIVASHGCRLLTQDDFTSGALGVTEGQSLGGAVSTIPATKREPGYTSRIGLEQATGHLWTIGGPLTSVGGSGWDTGPNRGNFIGETGLPLFGGNRDVGDAAGSRCSGWNAAAWFSYWYIGLRAACDHYQG